MNIGKQEPPRMTFSNTQVIDAGVDKISYKTDNLQLQCLMDSFAKAIDKIGPVKLEQILELL